MAYFDFPAEFRSGQVYLDEIFAWQLVAGRSISSVDNMSDRELRESIIDDLLGATMWEIQTEMKLEFTMERIRHNVGYNKERYNRIVREMAHPEIAGLIQMVDDKYPRIDPRSRVLYEAMEYCGTYYNGMKPSDPNAVLIVVNRENFTHEKVTSLAMDVMSTHQGPGTLN